MTSRSYFGKMNSILGSVVPLAMFDLSSEVITSIDGGTRIAIDYNRGSALK